MRTIETTVYEYHELPTDCAKEKARDWLATSFLDNPPWVEEHFNSMQAAIKASKSGKPKHELAKESIECKWTGYCFDGLLYDMIKNGLELTETNIRKSYGDAWKEEFKFLTTNIESLEGFLEANKYEFYEDGSFYG